MNSNPYPILRVRGLRKHFEVGHPRKQLNAIDDVELDLLPGETLAVVGESGSGKSTLARCIVRLIDPVPVRSKSTANPSASWAQPAWPGSTATFNWSSKIRTRR
jgi:ABC-type glutathione transport system ATPase component